jgi:hypothetical protein
VKFASPSQFIAVIARQAFRVRCAFCSVFLPDAAPVPQIIPLSESLILAIYAPLAPARSSALVGLDKVDICSHLHLPGFRVGLLYNPQRKR